VGGHRENRWEREEWPGDGGAAQQKESFAQGPPRDALGLAGRGSHEKSVTGNG